MFTQRCPDKTVKWSARKTIWQISGVDLNDTLIALNKLTCSVEFKPLRVGCTTKTHTLLKTMSNLDILSDVLDFWKISTNSYVCGARFRCSISQVLRYAIKTITLKISGWLALEGYRTHHISFQISLKLVAHKAS